MPEAADCYGVWFHAFRFPAMICFVMHPAALALVYYVGWRPVLQGKNAGCQIIHQICHSLHWLPSPHIRHTPRTLWPDPGAGGFAGAANIKDGGCGAAEREC
jgi:hypothetical protein